MSTVWLCRTKGRLASWMRQSGRVWDFITLLSMASNSKLMNCCFLEFSIYSFWTTVGTWNCSKPSGMRTTARVPAVSDMIETEVTGWPIRFWSGRTTLGAKSSLATWHPGEANARQRDSCCKALSRAPLRWGSENGWCIICKTTSRFISAVWYFGHVLDERQARGPCVSLSIVFSCTSLIKMNFKKLFLQQENLVYTSKSLCTWWYLMVVYVSVQTQFWEHCLHGTVCVMVDGALGCIYFLQAGKFIITKQSWDVCPLGPCRRASGTLWCHVSAGNIWMLLEFQ